MPFNTGPLIQLPPIAAPNASPEEVRDWTRNAGIALMRFMQQLYDDIAGGVYVYRYTSTDNSDHDALFGYYNITRARVTGNLAFRKSGYVYASLLDKNGQPYGLWSSLQEKNIKCYVLPNRSATSCNAFLPPLVPGTEIIMSIQPDDNWYLISPSLVLKGDNSAVVGTDPADTTACNSLTATVLTSIGKW